MSAFGANAAWTFTCDESGKFTADENACMLVGGVLLRGKADEHTELHALLRANCERLSLPFPPHATDVKRRGAAGALAVLRQEAWRWLEQRGAAFVALVSEPSRTVEAARHVRMLGALVDCAARAVSASGGARLDLQIASRHFPIAPADVAAARSSGLHVEQERDESWVEGVLGAEVRETVDALRRTPIGFLSPWPSSGVTQVSRATFGGAHAGIFVADLCCNESYAALREDRSARDEQVASRLGMRDPSRLLLVDYATVREVRLLDQALRSDPPDLLRAGKLMVAIEIEANGSRSGFGRWNGARRLAEHLWHGAIEALGHSLISNERAAAGTLRHLAAHVELDLDLKHGDYEGTWRALTIAWCGESVLASALRNGCRNRELAAKLWRLTLECANHRGDDVNTQRARREFRRLLAPGVPIRLVPEALQFQNLQIVALQNRLPADTAETARVLEELRESASQLTLLAREAAQLSALIDLGGNAPAPGPSAHDEEAELALRRALGNSEPPFRFSDRICGSCLGTAARSWAFLGQLDSAVSLLLEARAHFGESEPDLRFNAAVIARVELERARRARNEMRLDALRSSLALAGLELAPSPRYFVAAVRANPAARFSLDLWLRTLLWTDLGDEQLRAVWKAELGKGPRGRLFPLLESQRTHPTELVARHAGELLLADHENRTAAGEWFALSLAVSASSPEGTLTRFAAFTQALASRAELPEAPSGSLLNPTFEYR